MKRVVWVLVRQQSPQPVVRQRQVHQQVQVQQVAQPVPRRSVVQQLPVPQVVQQLRVLVGAVQQVQQGLRLAKVAYLRGSYR